jgi:hypothetical protein
VLLSSEGALHISIDCDDPARARHFKLQVGIMRDRIEAGKGSSPKQCVIAAAEGDDVEDQVLASKVVWRAEYYLQRYCARTTGFHTRDYPFEGGATGFDP